MNKTIAILVTLLAACTEPDERPARFEVGACGYTWMINGTCAPAYFAESDGVTGCCIPEEVDGAKQWTWSDCE